MKKNAKGPADCSVTEMPQYAKLEKGLRGFRAIALLSVFSKWKNSVLVDLLHEEKETKEWRRLHVGAERGVNCEHMQALLTNILQRPTHFVFSTFENRPHCALRVFLLHRPVSKYIFFEKCPASCIRQLVHVMVTRLSLLSLLRHS